MSYLDHLLRVAFFVTPLTNATAVYATVGVGASLVIWWPLVRWTGWARIPTLLALLSLAATLALSLAPNGAAPREGLRACILGAPRLLQAQLFSITTSPEALLNTVMLIPLGLFAVLAVRRVWPVALFILLLPTVVELSQTRIDGRYCSGIDYVTNIIGGLVGVVLGTLILVSWRWLGPVQSPGKPAVP